MSTETTQNDAERAIRAYFDPIRSVLFIDDQFPTYAEPGGDEGDVARALWTACRDRGWLCDIDNVSDWSSDDRKKRLVASDLLVLDYHLDGRDSGPALKIVEQLVSGNPPALAVIYTAETSLMSVLFQLVAHVRGASETHIYSELPDEIADIEDKFNWSNDAITSYISGGKDWKKEFTIVIKNNLIEFSSDLFCYGEQLIEKLIHQRFGAPARANIRRIDAIGSSVSSNWIQFGNVFISIVGKPPIGAHSSAADVLFNGLQTALREWNPPWLACLIARSRRDVNESSFRGDLELPHPSLQAGLLQFVRGADGEEERKRRSRQLAEHLLRRRFEGAATGLAAQIMDSLPQKSEDDPSIDERMHANAFLCAEQHERHHLRVGTVFRDLKSENYWVCVTPACDMVPRSAQSSSEDDQNLDDVADSKNKDEEILKISWKKELQNAFHMATIQLCMVKPSTALKRPEHGRYIFFEDYSVPNRKPLAARAFDQNTNQPDLEYMFALNQGQKSDNRFLITRTRANESGQIVTETEEAVVVCQLRAPYAERLTHIVGGHVSRIGVDFLSTTKRGKKKSQPNSP